VRDRSVTSDIPVAERADATDPGQVAAPFSGVVTLVAKEGDAVTAGQTVATIEAMKMEASITAPRDGTVTRRAISAVQQVEGGDLVLVAGLARPPHLGEPKVQAEEPPTTRQALPGWRAPGGRRLGRCLVSVQGCGGAGEPRGSSSMGNLREEEEC
jgi:pyruvate/2-oxoglutarate dehydrogenase complex dihydrolipoamide acyltransferase (E2) component